MKKNILLTLAAIVCLCGCVGNIEEDIVKNLSFPESKVASRSFASEENEELQILDFVEDESYESQTAVIMIAAERLDKYVSFTGERYIMASCTPEEVGLSQRVFEYMQGLMERQNANIHKCKDWTLVDGKVFEYSEFKYMPPKIASRSETTEPGGITGCRARQEWNGMYVDIYLSNSVLSHSAAYLGLTATILAYVPNPIVKTAVAKACGLAAAGAGVLAVEYPNGIIISIFLPDTDKEACVPYRLTSQ